MRSDWVSDEAGDAGMFWRGGYKVAMELAVCGIALGVGKSSLMGDTTPGFATGACGATRRIET